MKSRFTLFLSILFFSFSVQGQYTLTVNSPMSIAGNYDAAVASFGPQAYCSGTFSGNLNLVTDGTGGTTACDTVMNDQTGFIALLDRGGCNFTIKVKEAQEKGAIAVIICNDRSDPIFGPSGSDETISIPSFMVSQADCASIRVELQNSVNVTLTPPEGFNDPNADDIVVWGNQPGQGDFNNGLGNWVASGIDSEIPDIIAPENVKWVWDQDGLGLVRFNSVPLQSPSTCNGIALFDYTTYASDSLEDNFPSQPYPQLIGELRSPLIDLSGVTNTVGVKFHQINMPLLEGGINLNVRYSNDGGASWVDTVGVDTRNFINGGGNSGTFETEIVRLPLVGLAGSSNAVISFIYDGNFYNCGIDDVQIIEFADVNAELSSFFYSPASYGIPYTQGASDTIFFSGTVSNTGGVDLSTVQLTATVTRDENGETLFSNSNSITVLPIGQDSSISIEETFVPENLELGEYTVNLIVDVIDDTETNLSDNSASYKFIITSNTYAKENGPTTAFGFGVPAHVANLYRISPTASTEFVADSICFSVATNAASMEDNYVRVSLLRINDDVIEQGFANWDNNDVSLDGHPNFTVVGDEIHVLTNEQNFDLVSVPFTGGGIPLEPGASYLALLSFDDVQTGNAEVPNYGILPAYNDEDFTYTFISTVVALVQSDGTNDARWFLGGVTPQDAAVIRMKIRLVSSVDENPLPDESFNIYPNPVMNKLFTEIRLEESSKGSIILASIDGRVLNIEDFDNILSETKQIDVSSLPNGTYLIRISTELGSKTRKFVIQR